MPDAFPYAERIDIRRLRGDVEHISRHYPDRLAGSRAARDMAHYSAEGLSAAGAAGRVVGVAGLGSFPAPARLTLPGTPTIHLPAMTAGHSASTPAGGTEAQVVYAGGGTADELARADVRGKLVLFDLAVGPARAEKHRLAIGAGAAGLITINWGPDDGDELPSGSVKSVWGNPGARDLAEAQPALAALGIGRRDGLALAARLERGEAMRARIECAAENGWRPVHYTAGWTVRPSGVVTGCPDLRAR